MGVWIIAAGKLDIEPKVDDYIIQEFILFSKGTCPPAYYREKFFNTWFFDEQNRLVCHQGKFAEPSIWFNHLKENFFQLRGFVLKGDPQFIAEYEKGYREACEQREADYKKWIARRDEIENNKDLFLEHQKKMLDML